jgi:catechol 2,3-dioxygenase-like lactoylglutathione lyase family enzyme
MITRLERVVVAVDDLLEAMADYERLLGVPPSDAAEGLFALRNTSLQLVERETAQIAGREVSSAGVAGLVFEEDSRGASEAAEAAERAEWLDLADTRGIPIALARDDVDAAAPDRDVDAREVVAGLDHVVISTGDLAAARALYGERLGLRLALDRVFEKRGIQILFYRVGATTVEVVGPLSQADRPEAGRFPKHEDRFGGLAWEVADVDAIQARLASQGFDVSEVRTGHKPGTRVCSVRSSTHGVPTLLKGPDLG